MRRALITLLLLALAGDAVALSGRVLDDGTGAPLDAVTLTARWFNGEERRERATDAEGRFDIDLARRFGNQPPRSLVLVFERIGYVSETLFIERAADGGFGLAEPVVRLAVASGAGPVDGENSTLYVLPYSVSSGSAVTDTAELQGLIAEYLTSGLDIYLQEIPEPLPLEAFGLAKLADALDIANTREVLARGRALRDALAIVGGRVRVAIVNGTEQRVEFNSRYVTVPTVEGLAGRVLRWDDTLPAGLVSARPIAEQLNRLWGRNTVLAIGVAAFSRARTLEPDARARLLARVDAFVRAELREAGGDEPLVGELRELLARIEEARRP